MQHANIMCAEVDEDLFVGRKRRSLLRGLRGIASDFAPKLQCLYLNCEVLERRKRLRKMMLEYNSQSYVSEIASVGREIKDDTEHIFSLVSQTVAEFNGRVVRSIRILYREKGERLFRNDLVSTDREFLLWVEESGLWDAKEAPTASCD